MNSKIEYYDEFFNPVSPNNAKIVVELVYNEGKLIDKKIIKMDKKNLETLEKKQIANEECHAEAIQNMQRIAELLWRDYEQSGDADLKRYLLMNLLDVYEKIDISADRFERNVFLLNRKRATRNGR